MATDSKAQATIPMGVATPKTVISWWMDALSEFPDLLHDLQSIQGIIDSMASDDSGWRILATIAASVLNQDFEQSHTLHMVDENGKTGIVYYETEAQAKAVWLGMLQR